MFTEGNTPFSDTGLKFTDVFRKIVIIFIETNTPNNRFLHVTNKELRAINIYLEGATYSVNSICLQNIA